MDVRIFNALPTESHRYLVQLILGDGEFIEPGNWFGWGNRATFKEGDGWLVRSVEPDAYAKGKPTIENKWTAQPLPGHQGVHWVSLVPQGSDWRLKIKLGEPLPAGRYSVRVSEKASNFGDGTYLSGPIQAFEEVASASVSPQAASDAQMVADLTQSQVRVGRQEVQPIVSAGDATLEIAELRKKLAESESKRAEILFGEPKVSGHPDSPEVTF